MTYFLTSVTIPDLQNASETVNDVSASFGISSP